MVNPNYMEEMNVNNELPNEWGVVIIIMMIGGIVFAIIAWLFSIFIPLQFAIGIPLIWFIICYVIQIPRILRKDYLKVKRDNNSEDNEY